MNFTNSPYFFGLFSQGQWSPRPPRYTSTTLPCDMESTMMMGSSGCFFNSSMRSRRTWRGTAKNEQNQLAIFPECVARVPVSLWGSGGWGCVRSTLLPRPQPFATVRNRPQPSATVRAIPVWPCLWEVLQRWSFLGFADVSLLRFAWQAWHFVTFRRVLERVESRCVAGAILLWRCQRMCCSFRGRRSTLDVSIVIFRGRRSTLDVSCCVFFANRIGRAASSGDKVQIPWQSWHFVWCAENWRKPRTKHRFWGCKFSGSKENS